MTWKCIKKYLFIALGSSILSFGMYNFYYQCSITEGGVLGILLILKNVFSFDVSLTNIVLDGGMILLGLVYFGRTFFVNAIFGSAFFSIFYHLFESMGYLINIDNTILAAVLGGLCVGIGTGIIIKVGGAAGGDDVFALVVSKITKKKIGLIYLLSDLSVLVLSLSYLNVGKMLMSVIAVVISGQIINLVYNIDLDKILNRSEDAIKKDNVMGNHV